MNREKPKPEIPLAALSGLGRIESSAGGNCGLTTRPRSSAVSTVLRHLERCSTEGETPVGTDSEKGMSKSLLDPQRAAVAESGCLRVQPESGWYTPPKAKYTVGDR